MVDADDLDQAGSGAAAGSDAPGSGAERKTFDALDAALDKLDIMDALDDLGAGGAGGFATGIEIVGEQMAHSPYDDLLDAFEPVRDLADHSDFFDDIF